MQELLQNQYQQSIEVRFPVALYNSYGIHLAVWLLARALDPEGSGKASFDIEFAAATINRSISSVRRLLAGAKAKGLFHHFTTKGNICTTYYTSFQVVAAKAQLETIGHIAEITLDELPHLNIIATEVMAQGLQKSSYWNAKEVNRKQKNAIKPIHPEDVLIKPPCGTLARVLGFSQNTRWMFVTEKFVHYGVSQETIAEHRGLHPQTVKRHLSNHYRLQPSPVMGRRSDLPPIHKKQLAQRLPRKQAALVGLAKQFKALEASGRYLKVEDRVFYARTNLYYPTYTLVPCRKRRKYYQNFLSSENSRRGEGGVLVNVISEQIEQDAQT